MLDFAQALTHSRDELDPPSHLVQGHVLGEILKQILDDLLGGHAMSLPLPRLEFKAPVSGRVNGLDGFRLR